MQKRLNFLPGGAVVARETPVVPVSSVGLVAGKTKWMCGKYISKSKPIKHSRVASMRLLPNSTIYNENRKWR